MLPPSVIWGQSQPQAGEGAWEGAMERPLPGERHLGWGKRWQSPAAGPGRSCLHVPGMDAAASLQAQQKGTRAHAPASPFAIAAAGWERVEVPGCALGAAGRCSFLPALPEGDNVCGGGTARRVAGTGEDLDPGFICQSPRHRITVCSLALLHY